MAKVTGSFSEAYERAKVDAVTEGSTSHRLRQAAKALDADDVAGARVLLLEACIDVAEKMEKVGEQFEPGSWEKMERRKVRLEKEVHALLEQRSHHKQVAFASAYGGTLQAPALRADALLQPQQFHVSDLLQHQAEPAEYAALLEHQFNRALEVAINDFGRRIVAATLSPVGPDEFAVDYGFLHGPMECYRCLLPDAVAAWLYEAVTGERDTWGVSWEGLQLVLSIDLYAGWGIPSGAQHHGVSIERSVRLRNRTILLLRETAR